MSDEPTHKMVDGELIELTPAEIAEIKRMQAEFVPPVVEQTPQPKQEQPDARSRTRR